MLKLKLVTLAFTVYQQLTHLIHYIFTSDEVKQNETHISNEM